MSDVSTSGPVATSIDPRALLARAAGADLRARAALRTAIDDIALPPDLRLDERTRAMLTALLGRMVQSVAGELRDYAARLLSTRGAERAASLLAAATLPEDALPVGQPALIDECLARVRLELASAAVPPEAPTDRETPGLMIRLTRSPDRVVASAAAAFLAAEADRRAVRDGEPVITVGLPFVLHHPLVWYVAAALRRAIAAPDTAIDEALVAAAQRNLAAHDEGSRLEATAMRLAQAIDAHADELAPLIEEALRDGRLALVAGIVARAAGLSFQVVRALVVDADDDRLWLVLHALGLPRATIARVGLALSESDPRRDLEAFADTLDAVMTLDRQDAGSAMASLALDPDYRAALLAAGER